MDKRIRKNEFCVIGLPRCDYVFSSTRSCFIGYGFHESALEMTILRSLLMSRGIEPVEAGGNLAPGQNAFCVKICSKIILAQFCVILLNNDVKNGIELPNANVNMEYGLMLGFNKYVIPFQRASQQLPFNVAGLDTVKYSNEDFERKAAKALDVAIKATIQELAPSFSPDQVLESFLLSKRLMLVPLASEGDQNLYELGRPVGFNLVMTFDGMKYAYFGNFTPLRPEAVLWRLRTLEDIVQERLQSIPERVKLGIMEWDENTVSGFMAFLNNLRTFLLVTSEEDRSVLQRELKVKPSRWPVEVFSLKDIETALQSMA